MGNKRQKFRQKTRKLRRTLVVSVGIGGLAGAALHAEEPVALSAAELVNAELAFEGEADFDTAFAELPEAASTDLVQPGAVDITAVAPVTATSLGTGTASYYGRRFHGRLTASGAPFDMNAMTAAHKTLPFGTLVRVTNPRNGRSVVVEITDRGPYVAGRVLDVSRAAAEELDMIGAGHAEVELELLEG